MSDNSTVNSQITDSISQVVTLLTGQSPSQSFGMMDAVMLETLGMAMHNAVTRQQYAHMTSTAAVTAACAKMLQAPFPIAPPPPPPAPPPTVHPLAHPPDAPAPPAPAPPAPGAALETPAQPASPSEG
jgi:hypothetical protein